MLAIKLKKIGKKNQKSFRVVVSEKRSKMGGNYIEDLGYWNPRDKKMDVNKDRALYWIGRGAQPTDTTHNLLVKTGVLDAPKKAVHDEKAHKSALAEKSKKAEEAIAKKVEKAAEPELEAEQVKEEETTTPEEAPAETAPESEEKTD